MADEYPQTWYVKASFGAEWGPISADTLLGMADSGSLVGEDLARCGIDDDWQPISTVLEQLRGSGFVTVGDEGITIGTPVDAMSLVAPVSPDSAMAPELQPSFSIPTDEHRPGPELNWSVDWNQASAQLVPQVDPPPAVDVDIDIVEPRQDTDSDDQFAELNAWKRARKELLDRLMKIVSDREAVQARAGEAERLKKEADEAASHESNRESESEALGAASTASAKGPKSTHTVRASRGAANALPWGETLDRWKRSLPDAVILVTLLLLPGIVWWYWPTSDAEIADTFNLMYRELLDLRQRPGDKTGMAEFVQRSQTQLDQLIPSLQKSASPKNPDSQTLLWIGRDCLRPLLKDPRIRESKHEEMLKKLLAQWDQSHHIVRATKSSESDQSQPDESRLSSSPATTSPLGFGKAPDAPEAIDVQLPPNTPKVESRRRETNLGDQN